jgi:hypothetical protein
LEIVVEKLINYRVLDPTAVVSWIFKPTGAEPDFNRYIL